MVESGGESGSSRVLELAEEFLDRYRAGERPSLKEYADRHPELADEILEVFPALAVLENIAIAEDGPPGIRSARPPDIERLGDYRILRELGRGGMGVVYEAEQVSLGRHVALKLLPPQSLRSSNQRLRFEREARAAARLQHPHIVAVYGVGEHDGIPYFAMQFIAGHGLDEVLDELRRLRAGGDDPHLTTALDALEPIPARGTAGDVARSLWAGSLATREALDERTEAATRGSTTEPGPALDPREPADLALATLPRPAGEARDSPGRASSSSSRLVGGSEVTTLSSSSRRPDYIRAVARIGSQAADALACTTPTASCTATSSPPTSCWTTAATSGSPTSDSPRSTTSRISPPRATSWARSDTSRRRRSRANTTPAATSTRWG